MDIPIYKDYFSERFVRRKSICRGNCGWAVKRSRVAMRGAEPASHAARTLERYTVVLACIRCDIRPYQRQPKWAGRAMRRLHAKAVALGVSRIIRLEEKSPAPSPPQSVRVRYQSSGTSPAPSCVLASLALGRVFWRTVMRIVQQHPKRRPQQLELGGRTHRVLTRDQRLLGPDVERGA